MMDKYQSLITSQHQLQPKFIAWVMATVGMVEDAQSLLNGLYTDYDIDVAVGIQLDALGVILNLPRTLPFQPTGTVSAIMDDDTYRIALKSAIVSAHFDGTIPTLVNLLQTTFAGFGLHFAVQDNQDMTFSVIVFGTISSLLQDLFTHDYIIPRPQGVSISIGFSTNKVFSWNEETPLFAGWDEGYWVI
jgi:hypothetical protein